jgi:hypothetical protein
MQVMSVQAPKMHAGRIEACEEDREEKGVGYKGGELRNGLQYLLRKKAGEV